MTHTIKMAFAPTHTILTLAPGGAFSATPVLLDGGRGPAYTQAEWEAGAPADWEVADGVWTWRGRATPDGFVRVSVFPGADPHAVREAAARRADETGDAGDLADAEAAFAAANDSAFVSQAASLDALVSLRREAREAARGHGRRARRRTRRSLREAERLRDGVAVETAAARALAATRVAGALAGVPELIEHAKAGAAWAIRVAERARAARLAVGIA